ncbi:MAG: sec-independent protein translocase protein TatA [Planctomycetota bacterium]
MGDASNFIPFFGFLGTTEWIIIGGAMLLLFGGPKLPALARSLGTSFVEFKKGIKGEDDEPKLPDAEEKRQLPKDGGDR